jgi:hypothetical protein
MKIGMCCKTNGEAKIAISWDSRQTQNSRGHFYGRVIVKVINVCVITSILNMKDM